MNPFAFGKNSDFPISAHHHRQFWPYFILYSMVLFPTHDLGDHQPFFKMVFWQYVFRPLLGHVITKVGATIKVNEIYFLSKFA